MTDEIKPLFNTRPIDISEDGVWVGNGRIDDEGRIECAADLPDAAYEAIEETIRNGLDAVEVNGVTYTWEIEDNA